MTNPQSPNPTTYDEELDELVRDGFVGLYGTDEDGNFVPMDDKYSVLANSLKTAIKAATLRQLPEKKEYVLPKENENSLQRTTDNMAYAGYNTAIQDMKDNLGGDK